MRTPESKIKEAILHPEKEVRITALSYFSRSPSRDESIMSLVIQAVKKYGPSSAYPLLREAGSLPQTEATVRWLTDELSKDWNLDDVDHDNCCFGLALVLYNARIDLLRPEVMGLRCFPEELRTGFRERLEMASWDWETGWSALEQLGKEAWEEGHFRDAHVRRGEHIIESLARHPEQGEAVLPLLHRRYRGRNKSLMEWLEPFLVELAGRMRLEAAGPILVERLHEDDLHLNDSCLTALKQIGGDPVVRTIAEQWQEGTHDFRQWAAEVMEHIHTDLSSETCLKFFKMEEDEKTKDYLANALLGNFVEEALGLVRQMVVGDDDELTPDQSDLKLHLIAAATVMGASFPEYEQWYEDAVEHAWGTGGIDRDRIREDFQEEQEDDDWFDEDWEDDESGNLEDENNLDDEEFDEGVLDRPAKEIRREPVGRNEPCPCGSGKKYKKCCYHKGFDWVRDEDGNVFKSLPVSKELNEVVEEQMQRFVEKFGRKPGPGDNLFFDMPPLEHVEHYMVEAMKQAGLDPALIYAFEKTGLLVTEDNQHLIPDVDLKKWEAAMREYRVNQRRGGME